MPSLSRNMLHCKHIDRGLASSKVQWDSKVWWSCKSLMVCNKVEIYHEQSMHLSSTTYTQWGFIKQFVFDYQYNDDNHRCQCCIKPIISRQRRQRDNLYICQAEELSPIDIYWGACKVSGTDTFCYNLTWSIFSEINASETNLLLWNSYWKKHATNQNNLSSYLKYQLGMHAFNVLTTCMLIGMIFCSK